MRGKMKQIKKTVILETVNFCNLRCPACPCNTTMTRERKILQPSEFNIIFSKIRDIASSICFYFMGEPLLNPYIFDYIKIAHNAGIRTIISSNGMMIDKYINNFFTSGLDYLQIAFDGFDKTTHEAYRVGSSFEKVKDNIIKLSKAKSYRNLTLPDIRIQTIVNRMNENQLDDIGNFAKKHNISFATKKMTYGKTEDIININRKVFEPMNNEYRRESSKSIYYSEITECPQLIEYLVILSNGDVVPCCYDYNGSTVLGNLYENSIDSILNGTKRTCFENMKSSGNSMLCGKCDLII